MSPEIPMEDHTQLDTEVSADQMPEADLNLQPSEAIEEKKTAQKAVDMLNSPQVQNMIASIMQKIRENPKWGELEKTWNSATNNDKKLLFHAGEVSAVKAVCPLYVAFKALTSKYDSTGAKILAGSPLANIPRSLVQAGMLSRPGSLTKENVLNSVAVDKKGFEQLLKAIKIAAKIMAPGACDAEIGEIEQVAKVAYDVKSGIANGQQQQPPSQA